MSRAARTANPAPSRCATIFPARARLMAASVSMRTGVRGWVSGGNEASNDVSTRQESYHNPRPNHREAVHVLGAHQIGNVSERLVLCQTEDGPRHRLPRQDE